VALRLKRHGLTRVRPLLGGLALWMDQKHPVEEILAPTGRWRRCGSSRSPSVSVSRSLVRFIRGPAGGSRQSMIPC